MADFVQEDSCFLEGAEPGDGMRTCWAVCHNGKLAVEVVGYRDTFDVLQVDELGVACVIGSEQPVYLLLITACRYAAIITRQ